MATCSTEIWESVDRLVRHRSEATAVEACQREAGRPLQWPTRWRRVANGAGQSSEKRCLCCGGYKIRRSVVLGQPVVYYAMRQTSFNPR